MPKYQTYVFDATDSRSRVVETTHDTEQEAMAEAFGLCVRGRGIEVWCAHRFVARVPATSLVPRAIDVN